MTSLLLRRYVTGILPRHVFAQVFRAFAMALVTMTSVFVLIMVMAEATRSVLGPREVLGLIPLIIPVTLPYTVPVALLFAVSVVYGRMGSDNEVIAVKAAGLGAMTVLLPSLSLGLAVSGAMIWASNDVIPRINHEAKSRVFKSIESVFFMFLKRDREFNNPRWPFYISVKEVHGKTLFNANFKHRAKGLEDPDAYDARVFAERATMVFDPAHRMVHVDLDGAECFGGENIMHITNGTRLSFPFDNVWPEPRVQELTRAEIVARQAKRRAQIDLERTRQAAAAGLWIASGRIGRVKWSDIQGAFTDYAFWKHDLCELETEKQLRTALALGGFFFALLGAPVGIRFAKRDFLSAFITCFVPIILAYYPMTLLGMNLGKDGNVTPMIVFTGNAVLFVLAWVWALPPVLKH